jgi:alcohol dehydrogenase class IV
MIADYVILDAVMIKNLPRSIAAATGIDALCHAIECFTSNKANPFSDIFAMEALDLILNNIMPACDSKDAMEAKQNMQIASFYAGIAITASGTTAVHALSYPLGGKYHIAHGVSNAILLVPVMRFNEPACREKFVTVYDRCIHENKDCTTAEEKSAYILALLDKIVKHLDIPTSLSSFKVPASDLETLVEAGMQVTRLLVNNMKEVGPDDARAIYREIL